MPVPCHMTTQDRPFASDRATVDARWPILELATRQLSSRPQLAAIGLPKVDVRRILARRGRFKVSKKDEWMTRLIDDPSHRQRELGNASRLEALFSFFAVLFAVTAIWGFTASESVTEWLRPDAIGGLAVLCFAACMAIAANGGIRKRFIALVSAFDARARP